MGRDTLEDDLNKAKKGDIFIDLSGGRWTYNCRARGERITYPHVLVAESGKYKSFTGQGRELDNIGHLDSMWAVLSHKETTSSGQSNMESKPTNIKRIDKVAKMEELLPVLTSDDRYLLINNKEGSLLGIYGTLEAASTDARRSLTHDSEIVILETKAFVRPKPIAAEIEVIV